MKSYRVVFKGVVANLFMSETETNSFVIFCYGLPSYPPSSSLDLVQQLTNKGINVVCPEYYGTFSSEGVCTINNCVDTIHDTIHFLKSGQGFDQFSQKQIRWNCESITILGVSFGGSIALVTGAKSSEVTKIIAVSAPTNYRDHNKKYPEENLQDLVVCLNNVYQNTWRITPEGLRTLLDGSGVINPVDYLLNLKNKDILFIHALGDPIVNYKRSEELYYLISKGSGKHQLELINSNLHLSFSDIDVKLGKKILKWIKQT